MREYNYYLQHHGILGQKWGIRRYQNEDGTLTDAGKKRLKRKDDRWINRNEDRIYNKTYKKSKREIEKYAKKELDKKYPKNGRTYMNEYNKKLAELMNKNVGEVETPSGRVIQYVAKRGEYGVYTAIADKGYDMGNVKNGVWNSGKIGYKNSKVGIMER